VSCIGEAGFPRVVNVVPIRAARRRAIGLTPRGRKNQFSPVPPPRVAHCCDVAGEPQARAVRAWCKGANIVFDDADIAPARQTARPLRFFHNQGQACIRGSRLILHEKIADEFVDRFVALASSIKVATLAKRETEMGPLTSQLHRTRVLGLRAGGPLDQGWRTGSPGAGPRGRATWRERVLHVEPTS